MPFIYLNYIYSTIFNILLIFISIYNAPYQQGGRKEHDTGLKKESEKWQ